MDDFEANNGTFSVCVCLESVICLHCFKLIKQPKHVFNLTIVWFHGSCN